MIPLRALSLMCASTLVATLALSACNDSTPSSDPSSASSSTADSPTSATSEPSTSPTPTVEPATGPMLEQKTATVRLPQGWELTENQATIQASGAGPFADGFSLVALSSLKALNTTDTPDDLARYKSRHDYGQKTGTVEPEATIDGVAMGHVTGTYDGDYIEQFITLYQGEQVSILFSLEAEAYSTKERRDVVDSVMASWQWR